MPTLLSLPAEIHFNILIHTNPSDLGRLSCVCKELTTVCEDVNIWRVMNTVYFGGPHVDSRGYRMTLIKNVCELDYCDTMEEKVMWIVQKGHFNALRRLLLLRPSLVHFEMKNVRRTLLHMTAFNKDTDTARVLIELGINVNVSDYEGCTPLHIACEQGHTEMVSLLVRNKALVNHKDKKGRSSLHKATYQGHMDCIDVLLGAPDIDVDLVEGSYGQTALHIACGRGHTEIAKRLIKHHANVNAVDMDGWSPLHNSCYKGNTGVVCVLLHHRAQTDLLISNRWSALSFAEDKGFHDIVNMLRNSPSF